MVNLEELKRRGRRAYELGRLRVAARIALLLGPATLVCLLGDRNRSTCACSATLLLTLAIALRWQNRRGTNSVRTGLLAGLLPLAAGLLLNALGVDCMAGRWAPLCATAATLVGGAAGIYIGRRAVSRQPAATSESWPVSAVVAALFASLGCARLGIVGLGSVIAGIALGTLATTALVRRA